MTRIDFYQISGDEQVFACRLIDLVYRRGHQVYVHTGSRERASAIDDALWGLRADAFIPHVLQGDALETPVVIGYDYEPEGPQDVLINLSGDVPAFFSRFERVAEVVPVEQNSRLKARENYRYYQARGYQLKYHEID